MISMLFKFKIYLNLVINHITTDLQMNTTRKKIALIFLVTFIVVAIVDCVGAVASRNMLFDYSNLWPLTLIIYFTFGYLMGKQLGKMKTIVATVCMGILEVGLGWFVVLNLKPNIREMDFSKINTLGIIVFIIVMIGLYALPGWLGWQLANRGSKKTAH